MKQVSGAARGKRAPLDLSRNSNSVHDKEKRLRKLLTSGLAAMVVVPGKGESMREVARDVAGIDSKTCDYVE